MGKIFLVVYALFGLIAGALFTLVAITGLSMSGGSGTRAGMLFGIGAIILIPIIYGILGFISGVIFGAIYNIAARYVGGIEMEVEIMSTHSTSAVPSPSNNISS